MSLNYKKLITGIFDQQLQPADIHNEKWKKIAQVIQSSRYLQVNGTEGLADYLIFIHKKCNPRAA